MSDYAERVKTSLNKIGKESNKEVAEELRVIAKELEEEAEETTEVRDYRKLLNKMKVKDLKMSCWYASERHLLDKYADAELECYLKVDVPQSEFGYAQNVRQQWVAFVFKGKQKYFGYVGGMRVQDAQIPQIIAVCEGAKLNTQKPTKALKKWALLAGV